MTESDNVLAKIFKDASTHAEVAKIMARHLSSKEDVRDVALAGIDLSEVKKILDLGCGFGFFTEALKNRVLPDSRITGIDCHPEYEWFFFQACEKINIKKEFSSNGCKSITHCDDRSFDLILCSYALYFFPEMISEISRILKKYGTFITITHAIPHLHQVTHLAREFLLKNGITPDKETPYESLISKFSDMNGAGLLSPYFGRITRKRYENSLIFRQGDFEDFAGYFNFKRSFFIPQSQDPNETLHKRMLDSVKGYLEENNDLIITKNDMIYICSEPLDPLEK